VTNEDLAALIDTSDEWIRSHTGIGARHIAADDVASSDLGYEAALNALQYALDQGLVAEKSLKSLIETIDLIVLGSSTQDYYSHPSTACIVQNKLGAVNAAAFDITEACSSFIFAFETARALLGAGNRRRALVIGAEVLSKITNWDERETCVLFGDGAGAVLLEQKEGGGGIIRSVLGSDGSGWEHLILRRGGSRNPWKKGEVVEQVPAIEMNGHAVYNFAVKVIIKTIKTMLDEEGIELHDLDLIIPHQANGRIIQAAGKRLNIPEEKFYTNMEEYANTSSASIPIALDECNRSGRIKRGDLVMTVGFGGGLSYGGNLIRW
jgi:3-oxoacyl-[acyl-carrier-protein] synthase-3